MIDIGETNGELALQRIDYMQPASETTVGQMFEVAGKLVDPEKVHERTVELSTEWKQLTQIAEAMPIREYGGDTKIVHPADVAKKLFGENDLPASYNLNEVVHSIQRSRPTERDYIVEDQFFKPPRGAFVVWSRYDDWDRRRNFDEGTEEKTLELVGSELTERLAHISALQTLRDDPNFHYTFALPEQGKHEYFTQKIADHIVALQGQAYMLMRNDEVSTSVYQEWDGRKTHFFNIARTHEVNAAGASILELAGDMAIHEASSYGAGFTPGSTAANTADAHPGMRLAKSTVQITGRIFSEADKACENAVRLLDDHYNPRLYSDPWVERKVESIKQRLNEQRLLRAAMQRLYESQAPQFLDVIEYHTMNISAQLGEPARTEKARKQQQAEWPKAFDELKVAQDSAKALTVVNGGYLFPKNMPVAAPIEQIATEIQALTAPYLNTTT